MKGFRLHRRTVGREDVSRTTKAWFLRWTTVENHGGPHPTFLSLIRATRPCRATLLARSRHVHRHVERTIHRPLGPKSFRANQSVLRTIVPVRPERRSLRDGRFFFSRGEAGKAVTNSLSSSPFLPLFLSLSFSLSLSLSLSLSPSL